MKASTRLAVLLLITIGLFVAALSWADEMADPSNPSVERAPPSVYDCIFSDSPDEAKCRQAFDRQAAEHRPQVLKFGLLADLTDTQRFAVIVVAFGLWTGVVLLLEKGFKRYMGYREPPRPARTRGTMEDRRRRILIQGLVVVALVGLVPPWLHGDSYENPTGHSLIFIPPGSYSLDGLRLLVEWLVVAAITGIRWLSVKSRDQEIADR